MLGTRYPPLQPDLDAMLRLPQGSLGHEYAHFIRSLNVDPEFFRPRPLDTEARWLTQRIATTHDIHHVVSGFNTNPDGEIGVLAITALQIGFPAYVLLTSAAQLASFRFQLELLSRPSPTRHPVWPLCDGKRDGRSRWRSGAGNWEALENLHLFVTTQPC